MLARAFREPEVSLERLVKILHECRDVLCNPTYTLSDLLVRASTLEYKDKRDMVYSILGVVSKGYADVIQMKDSLSLKDVFMTAVIAAVKFTRRTDLLCDGQS